MERVELIKTLAEGRQMPPDLGPYMELPITELVAAVNKWPGVNEIPDNRLMQIKEFFSVKNSPDYIKLKRRINESLRYIDDYRNRIESQARELYASDLELRKLEQGNTGASDSIGEELINWLKTQDFYTFRGVFSGRMSFHTKPVMLKHTVHKLTTVEQVIEREESDKIDFGSYSVTVCPESGAVMVHPYEDNIIINESDDEHITNDEWNDLEDNDQHYYHPHVDTCGYVCWGTAQELYSEYKQGRQPSLLVQLLTDLKSLLSTYNDASPYRSLDRFVYPGECSPSVQYQKADSRWYSFANDSEVLLKLKPSDILERTYPNSVSTELRAYTWKRYENGDFVSRNLRLTDGTFIDVEELENV